MRVSTPFNHHVPKGIRDNFRWRAAVHKRVIEDLDFADVVIGACRQDPLFFINGFGWTYAPKADRPFSKVPFILYPFQEGAVLELIRAFAVKDKLIVKSRDMGASWVCVCAVLWAWYARRGTSFLLGSRVQEYVDQSGNPKSMFWKFDYFLDNLPHWLKPVGYDKNVHRRAMHAENPEMGSVIDGESTNKNFARGDRRTAIINDEFAAVENGPAILAATRDATNCRIWNSTPQGTGNSFYDLYESSCEKIRMHWSQHPEKSIGLYTTDEHGKLKVLDRAGFDKAVKRSEGDEAGFTPILDGKLRSPWYDNECKRGSAQEIAQELDMDFLGSGYQFFNADLVRQAIRDHARPPILVGDLEYDTKTGEPIKFREDPSGNLRLWFLLDRDGNPPKEHKYSFGIDVAAGTGASNSTIQVWDCTLHEKVAEYTNPFIRPESLAKQAFAIGRWVGNAFAVWESGGPGRQFGSRLVELGYTDIYYRKREEAISKKVSDIPGIAQTRESKLVIMSGYRAAIEKSIAVNRSKEALEETLEYIFSPDGSVTHSRAASKNDPSGAKANHGDRAMGDALAWKGIMERTRSKPPPPTKPRIPVGCLAWRMEMRKKKKQKANRELSNSWRIGQ